MKMILAIWDSMRVRDESSLSNVTGLSDPVIPDNTSVLLSVEAPKHYTEEMEEMEERFRDGAVI
jgi:hypothetical protein